jgi:hypothetical protein
LGIIAPDNGHNEWEKGKYGPKYVPYFHVLSIVNCTSCLETIAFWGSIGLMKSNPTFHNPFQFKNASFPKKKYAQIAFMFQWQPSGMVTG